VFLFYQNFTATGPKFRVFNFTYMSEKETYLVTGCPNN
jgi:hypothetical protein